MDPTDGARCFVVAPLFKDVPSFVVVRERVLEALRDSTVRVGEVRFVVADDTAGQDPEMDQLRALSDVAVVTPPFNLGHQRAIVVALRACASDFDDDDLVVTMDGDGEDKPEDVPALLEPLLRIPAPQVVLARRTQRKESLSFKLLYTAFRVLFRALTGRAVRSGNFAAYRGRYARTTLLHPSFDLCYSSTLLTVSQDDLAFVPCARGDRFEGRSRMSPEKLLTHGVRMLMPFADRIAIRSLVLCAATAAIAIAAACLLLVGRLSGWDVTSAWGWVIGASLVLAGIGFVNFLVLFSGFAQSSALSLARISENSIVEHGPA